MKFYRTKLRYRDRAEAQEAGRVMVRRGYARQYRTRRHPDYPVWVVYAGDLKWGDCSPIYEGDQAP